MTAPESDHLFAGAVPDIYDELFVPLIFTPYAIDVTERLAGTVDGDLLEIAAGTGAVTRLLADTLPAAVAITATDLNQAMLDRAERIGTSRPVRFRQADVFALPFDDASFDVVVCQFGVMFFRPQPAAFAEIRRVLRPGGRLLFNVWESLDRNDFARVVTAAVNALAPDDPSHFFERTPHGYRDPATIVADLLAGGFTADPVIERVDRRSRAAGANDVAVAYCQGTPLRGELEARGTGALAAATAAAEAAITAEYGTGPIEAAISALVVDVVA
ncbi:MAG: putative methyltransferase, ubiE/COQ5 family [Ilumatobacteraceae bacterium]|nr:putative methyltransferase, ubiE/COQ5 family [Ilumatobacteraceae bacterium]